jgi:hypothetical protein
MQDRFTLWLSDGLRDGKKAGKTQTGLAKALRIGQPQISRMLAGERTLKAHEIPLAAAYLGVAAPSGETARIVGSVGQGQLITLFEADDDLEEIDVPPSMHAVEALLVRDWSMYPVYNEGELVLYELHHLDPALVTGRPGVAQLRDGRRMLTTIRRGSSPTAWTLEIFNQPPVENIAVEWATPVRWVDRLPRRRGPSDGADRP